VAVFFSSLVFALVHPQGAIGVVPLMTIGMVLAYVREWRESLIAPMLVHACFNGGTLIVVLLVMGK
jgi:membrane protease YdiL (CAAX protease family)